MHAGTPAQLPSPTAMDDLFTLLRAWPTLQNVSMQCGHANQWTNAYGNVEGLVEHARELSKRPGLFAGKLRVTIYARNDEFDFNPPVDDDTMECFGTGEELGDYDIVLVNEKQVHVKAINRSQIAMWESYKRRMGIED